MFRSLVSPEDIKAKGADAITDYLEKHFKEKEALKKQRQMMGQDEDVLRKKIEEKEASSMVKKVKIDTKEFQSRREVEKKDQEYI